MKKTIYMHLFASGAIALLMAGCQSAAKKNDVAQNANVTNEDEAFDQEVLESFNRREDISTYMSYYEDEIKAGRLKLSELRKANRGPASVFPTLVKVIEGMGKNADSKFIAQALDEVNRQGANYYKSKWEPVNNLSDLKKRIFDDTFDELVTVSVRKNVIDTLPEKFARQKKSYIATVERQAKEVADAKARARQVQLNPKTVSDDALVKKALSDVKKTEGGVVENPYIVNKLDEFHEVKIKEINENEAKILISREDADTMRGHLKVSEELWADYHRTVASSGRDPGIPDLDGETCKIFMSPNETKNWLDYTQVQVNKAHQLKKQGDRFICTASLSEGPVQFRKSKGDSTDEIAFRNVESMGKCHITGTQKANYAAQLLIPPGRAGHIPKAKRFKCQ